jgi:serine/threonine-protein kinase
MASPGLVLESRYRLDELIAEGGMGEVWRAADLVLDRPVAVKLLRAWYAEKERDRDRFRAEARHAGSLSHPGIAQVYDYCEAGADTPACLVMELVDGPSLARVLDEGALDPARTMDVVAQAARGLQAAHAAGLVHRDIKPGNLVVSKSGRVKITDFGIAYLAGSASMTVTGMMMGTPAYLAPERVSGATATPAADLYALGIVAYQCLTGRVPFEGEPLAVALAHQERAVPRLPPPVPAEVAALVAVLTAKDPRARPASAGEVAARAERLRASLSGPAGDWQGMPALAVTAAAVTAGDEEPTLDGLPAGAGSGVRGAWDRARRAVAGHPARTGAVTGAVAVAGAATWVLAAVLGMAPAHHPPAPAARPSVHSSGPSLVPSSPGTVAARPARSRDRGQHHATASAPASQGQVPPTPTPAPSTPATPSVTPDPSDTATDTPTPTPTPDSGLVAGSGG